MSDFTSTFGTVMQTTIPAIGMHAPSLEMVDCADITDAVINSTATDKGHEHHNRTGLASIEIIH
jgi:hypothetical protein